MSTNDERCDNMTKIRETRSQDCNGQGQKLAQSFSENIDENDNNVQLHHKSTPLLFPGKECELLDIPHQSKAKQIKRKTKMPASFTNTKTHSVLSNENPIDTVNSLFTNMTLVPVPELTSSDLHNTVTHDQQVVKQIELEAKKPASQMETITPLIPEGGQSLVEDSIAIENSEPLEDTHLLVLELVSSYLDELIPHHQSNVEQIEPEVLVPASPVEITMDDMFSNIPSDNDNSTDTENSLTQKSKHSVQELLLASLDDCHSESNCKCPEQSVNDVNKTKSLKDDLQYTCHVINCGRMFSNNKDLKKHLEWHHDKKNFICVHCNEEFVHKDQLILHIRRHFNDKKTKCQCPNCSADGGNKMKDTNGNLQHICHISNCKKIFDNIITLKRHLASHRDKKSFILPPRDTEFERKDNVEKRSKKSHTRADRQVSHESSFPLKPLPLRMSISSDSPPLLDHEDSSINTINTSQAMSESEVLIPASTLEKSTSPPTPVGNESCFDDSINTATASMYKSDSESTVQYSPQTRQKTSRQDNTPTLTAEKPKRRVRQSECRCPYCSEKGGNKTKGPNGKSQHICHFDNCKKIFSAARALYRHLRLHEEKKDFICPHCNKAFYRTDTLKAHVTTHMTSKQNTGRWGKCQCANCMLGGKKTECLENRWQHACPYCERAYANLSNLKNHLHSHSDEKKYFCDHCNKGFTRKDKLGWHMNIHTKEGQKWTRCNCPNCSADDDNKIRAANGKLLHICHIPNCGKLYDNSWILKRHLETHSGKKNYFCPHCGKGYARQDVFDHHMKRYSEIKQKEINETSEYVCNVRDCKRVFKSSTSLKSHLKYHKKENDNGGFAGKDKSRKQGKRSMTSTRNKLKNISNIDTQITKNGQVSLTSKRTNIQHNLSGSQIACNIDGCGEIYNSVRLLSVHLKYYHRA